MDFYELAAKLLMSAQGRSDGPVPAVYGEPSVTEGKKAADYLEGLGLIKVMKGIEGLHWKQFRFLASPTAQGKALIGRLRGDVGRIAEYFRQQDNPPSPAIDQSTHIHGNNIGAVVAHSLLEDSPIIINSSVAELFEKIAQALRDDSTLKAEEREDAMIDVEQLKLENRRKNPNKSKMKGFLLDLKDFGIALVSTLAAEVITKLAL